MTRSTKYRVYTHSKHLMPTVFPHQGSGAMVFGRKRARTSIERQIGRSLKEDTVEDDNPGLWIFREPR